MTMKNIEALIEDEGELTIKPTEFKQTNMAQNGAGFNAMTLFAYSGDSSNDFLANAFIH